MEWTTGCLKYPKVSDTAANGTWSIHVFTYSGPDPGHVVKNRSIIGITPTCGPSKTILQFIFRDLRAVGRQLFGGAMPGEMPPDTWDLLIAKETLFPYFVSTHLIIAFRGCAEPSITAIWCLSHVKENNLRHRKHDFPHTAHQAKKAYHGRSAFSKGQIALAANFLSPCARWISRPKSTCANIHGPQNFQFSSRMRAQMKQCQPPGRGILRQGARTWRMVRMEDMVAQNSAWYIWLTSMPCLSKRSICNCGNRSNQSPHVVSEMILDLYNDILISRATGNFCKRWAANTASCKRFSSQVKGNNKDDHFP